MFFSVAQYEANSWFLRVDDIAQLVIVAATELTTLLSCNLKFYFINMDKSVIRKHKPYDVVNQPVSLKIAVFWVVAPCSLVEVYQHQHQVYTSNRLHSTTQKIAIFILTAMRTSNPSQWVSGLPSWKGWTPCPMCAYIFLLLYIYVTSLPSTQGTCANISITCIPTSYRKYLEIF
jgi:hypothetical protein